MAAADPWKRYLDAGMELSNLTRRRAEKIVKDFVREGTVRGEQAQERVEELMDRSRKASEHLVDLVRTEVSRQMETLGLIQPAKKAVAAAANKTPVAAKATAKKATGAAQKATGAAKKTTGAAKKTTGAAKKTTGAAKKTTGRT